jgi:hypothetical protein
MQRATDRQKTLAARGALLSDQRLPLQVTPPADVNDLEGRVLGHGQEDATGRAYMLIEGTDAKVHFIYYESGIEAARHRGLMRVNSFVRIHKSFKKGRGKLTVDDLGDAEKILADKSYMRQSAQDLIKRGAFTDEISCWGGWLGRYKASQQAELKAIKGTTQHPDRPLGGCGRQ